VPLDTCLLMGDPVYSVFMTPELVGCGVISARRKLRACYGRKNCSRSNARSVPAEKRLAVTRGTFSIPTSGFDLAAFLALHHHLETS